MLKEAEIFDRTGVVYLREGTNTSIGTFVGPTLNLLDPMFSWTGTGEVIRAKPNTQSESSHGLLPYDLLSTTTGSELHGLSALLLVIFVLALTSDRTVTDYHTRFQIEDSMQIKLHAKSIHQVLSADPSSVSTQAERLRAISGLSTERLAKIFTVSRKTYQNWLTDAKAPHESHREHLLEVLPLMEEAAQRLGGPGAVSNWLLTPVSSGEKKPIDYLEARLFSSFRGFLLHVRTGREAFRPFTQPNRAHFERAKEDIEHGIERLRPSAWKEEAEEDGEIDTDL